MASIAKIKKVIIDFATKNKQFYFKDMEKAVREAIPGVKLTEIQRAFIELTNEGTLVYCGRTMFSMKENREYSTYTNPHSSQTKQHDKQQRQNQTRRNDMAVQQKTRDSKNSSDLSRLEEKLRILYEYEKKYLDLLKEYKEEIKFAAALQEDLRKERTKFFAESLKEVFKTLKDAQVESQVASMWIKELVDSYTRSLDLSSGLIEEHTLDMIAEIREEAKKEAQSLKLNNEKQDTVK